MSLNMKGIVVCAGLALALGLRAAETEYRRLFAELSAADRAADAAWESVKTPEEFQAPRCARG